MEFFSIKLKEKEKIIAAAVAPEIAHSGECAGMQQPSKVKSFTMVILFDYNNP